LKKKVFKHSSFYWQKNWKTTRIPNRPELY